MLIVHGRLLADSTAGVIPLEEQSIEFEHSFRQDLTRTITKSHCCTLHTSRCNQKTLPAMIVVSLQFNPRLVRPNLGTSPPETIDHHSAGLI